ncbi:right-handed parallel beta-helix repeat-containing protein [Rubinisphaera margarita]|uniref:right-handed parallel beta-helix repeat-containing protein n=1 Tax=Rubinisphaera margarita TaxID=2909586 RepID=UPI001EE86C36|nr:right-handed parallel beta-helix repeat-containing protein [Rubinisphaera margarita]MCG6154840.1 right-handed parallel beta-helix repeat-containing protein [Rubinisphaera margarita]
MFAPARTVALSLALILQIAIPASAEVSYHVSPQAKSAGDGSSAQPYRSLAEVRDRIRADRKAGQIPAGESVVIHIAPGDFQLESTFELGPEDGGTAEAPVIYRATEPGSVRLQGGITLKPERFAPVDDSSVRDRLDKTARNHVLVCDLSEVVSKSFPEFKTSYRGSPAGPWLYVDHEPMTLARWPNTDAESGSWATFSKAVDTGLPNPKSSDPTKQKLHPGAFVFEDSRPARWNLDEGVWLLGYWTHDWSDEVIRIAGYDRGSKVISLAAPHNYGINGGTWGAAERRFFALNTLDELDAPGEWYLDRNQKRLYLYPEGSLKNSSIVLATLSQPLLQIKGAKHLRLEGLTFEYGHSDGVSLEKTEHVELAGCVVANLASTGIRVDGSNNTVRSCDVYNIGRGGISVNGGDRKSLTPAKNLIVNNHIHHYGNFQRTYAPGINVQGCGQVVKNNLIHDAPHNAVLYGGNEHLLERNEVHSVVLETGDAGAFYTGRNWTSQGNVLKGNYIHDLGSGNPDHVNTMGIYLDDCDSGDTLQGNIFVRAGRAIMIGGGRNNPVLGNIVIDCPIGLHIDSRGMTWKQWNNPDYPSWMLEEKAKALDYQSPPWSTRYPHLARIMEDSPREPLHNPILGNLFVDCKKQVTSFDGNVKKLIDKFEISDNVAVNSTGADGIATPGDLKGFTTLTGSESDPVTCRVVEQSGRPQLQLDPRLSRGTPPYLEIELSQIGLYTDKFRKNLPAETATPSR